MVRLQWVTEVCVLCRLSCLRVSEVEVGGWAWKMDGDDDDDDVPGECTRTAEQRESASM